MSKWDRPKFRNKLSDERGSPTGRKPSEPRMQQLNEDEPWTINFQNIVNLDYALIENRIVAIHRQIADVTGITEVMLRGNEDMNEVKHIDGAMKDTSDLRAKLRLIVSHATGGSLQDIDLPTNEISVRITERSNMVYAAGKKEAEKALIDMLTKCRAQFFKYEMNHKAKKTPESLLKAKTNEDFVNEITKVLKSVQE